MLDLTWQVTSANDCFDAPKLAMRVWRSPTNLGLVGYENAVTSAVKDGASGADFFHVKVQHVPCG